MTKSIIASLAIAFMVAAPAARAEQTYTPSADELAQQALADQLIFSDEDELTPDQIAEDMGVEPMTDQNYIQSQEDFWNNLQIESVANSGWVKINVDLSRQHLSLTSSAGDSVETIVSTGKSGHRTPTGCWHVYSQQTMHYSRKYDNAPMPYSNFFYGGYAIHGSNGVFDGKPHSHGCVRVPRGTDKQIFMILKQYPNKNISVCISQ